MYARILPVRFRTPHYILFVLYHPDRKVPNFFRQILKTYVVVWKKKFHKQWKESTKDPTNYLHETMGHSTTT